MLRGLVWNVILAFTWFFLSGTFTMGSFIVGLIFGYFCLYLAQSQVPSIKGYAGRVAAVISFILFFISEVAKSTASVVKMIVYPGYPKSPGLIAVPLTTKNDAVLTIMANFTTITPGSISMDFSDDKSTMYIHALDLSDPEEFIASIQDLEKRVQRLFNEPV